MILNASSINDEDAPGTSTTHCTTFFSKKYISQALDYLQTTIDQEMECCVHIDTGLIAALHAGYFLRYQEDSPSNFSFFLTPKKRLSSSNIFCPTMVLQLKASQGKGWSDTDLKDALKQGIVAPRDIHEFGHQLKNFWGLRLPSSLVRILSFPKPSCHPFQDFTPHSYIRRSTISLHSLCHKIRLCH